MALEATLQIVDDGLAERRSGTRAPIGRASTLRDEDDQPHRVIVEDLSATGFRFVGAGALLLGTRVRIGLAGAGTSLARVTRREGDSHGCIFERPLTPVQLQSAFTLDGAIPGNFPRFATAPATVSADPVVEPWPRQVRAAVLFGGGLLTWAIVSALARLL